MAVKTFLLFIAIGMVRPVLTYLMTGELYFPDQIFWPTPCPLTKFLPLPGYRMSARR